MGIICCLGLFACSDDGGFKGPDGGQACSNDGEERCSAGAHRRCEGGAWKTLDFCASSEVCSDSLGCVECMPGRDSCKDGDAYACNADGTFGNLVKRCLTQACVDGSCGQNNCSPESQLIYVVDHDYNLLSFDPRNDSHRFKPINRLSCAAKPSWVDWALDARGHPFSMSVDREGRAWVLYSSGEVFWVNVKSGACLATRFQPGTNGYELFGMGFVAEEAGSDKEQLFVFGGKVGQLERGTLATVDEASLSINTVGPLALKDRSPELTGTGNGKLFGFFPGVKAFVAEIDKETGRFVQEWSVGDLGNVVSWAFAHWGGRFYIFVTEQVFGISSKVLRFDPSTGKTETIVPQSPFQITGAGVSTCAPVIS